MHQLLFDVLHPVATDDAGDLRRIRIELRGPVEKLLKAGFMVYLLLQLRQAVTREPTDDLIHLFFRTRFFLRLLDIVRIYTRERHFIYPFEIAGHTRSIYE